MKAKAFWLTSLLLATFFPSHARAQLTGPLPGANIGDFVDLPMLVNPAVLPSFREVPKSFSATRGA